MNVQITLVDGNGNVLATGVGGSTNVDSQIENYVAPTAGTYYVEVTGDPGVQYSLTVTRSANFDIKPNGTINTAQPLTGTNGVLGALNPGGSLASRQPASRASTSLRPTTTAAACLQTPTRRWATITWSRR